MEEQYQNSTVDYSLKDGETIVLQLKNVGSLYSIYIISWVALSSLVTHLYMLSLSCWQKGGGNVRSKFFDQGLNKISIEEKGNGKEPVICLKPPPPPLAPLSPSVSATNSPSLSPKSFSLEEDSKDKSSVALEIQSKESTTQDNESSQVLDDDFGDFQAAG